MVKGKSDKSNFGDWFDNHRMITVGIFLLIIWTSLWFLFYLKADEITKDPCTICAQNHGDDVICRIANNNLVKRTYADNGSVYDESPQISDYLRTIK